MKGLLEGSRCVVAGATGNVGRGAAKAFLAHGASAVVIAGRDRDRLEALAADYLGSDRRIIVVAADTSVPEGALRASELAGEKVGAIDHLVSSSGPWWDVGPLLDLDYETWRRAMRANLDSHFLIWRHFGGLMARGASYVIVNGHAALGLPDTGLTGICANAVHGLASVIMAEGKGRGLRSHELMIGVRVADGPPAPGMPSAEFGRLFAAIAAGRTQHEAGVMIDVADRGDFDSLAARL
jgi:NAD(P)-dependent dehydrogenase (short-subunit alcohol dehydrogenase family)